MQKVIVFVSYLIPGVFDPGRHDSWPNAVDLTATFKNL